MTIYYCWVVLDNRSPAFLNPLPLHHHLLQMEVPVIWVQVDMLKLIFVLILGLGLFDL
jgi:hypothetical protein